MAKSILVRLQLEMCVTYRTLQNQIRMTLKLPYPGLSGPHFLQQ